MQLKYVVLNGDSQKGVASLINVKWYTLRCTFAKSRMCAKMIWEGQSLIYIDLLGSLLYGAKIIENHDWMTRFSLGSILNA